LAFEFSPQDPSIIYVAEQRDVVKVIDTGAQQSTFIDISSQSANFRFGSVNNIQDRGLLDIALDPKFGQLGPNGQPGDHNYVYAFAGCRRKATTL
jgi:hypothetical protein